jgi:hypothetical protein
MPSRIQYLLLVSIVLFAASCAVPDIPIEGLQIDSDDADASPADLDSTVTDAADSNGVLEITEVSASGSLEWARGQSRSSVSDEAFALTETLERLHETAETAFESAPNFGYQRLPGSFRDTTPPRHDPIASGRGFEDVFRDREIRGGWSGATPEPKAGEAHATQAWLWLNGMHALCRNGFVYRPTDVRLSLASYSEFFPDWLVCGFPDQADRSWEKFANDLPMYAGDASLWKVKSFELIGLWRREEPVVFVAPPEKIDFDGAVHEQPVRQASEFEIQAVDRLRNSSELVSQETTNGKTIHLVGAIRAKQRCLACHETEENALLGAFTYEIARLEE